MIARRLVSRPVSTIGTLIAPRVTQEEGPRIVTEGLVGHWDAGNPYSYPGTGTTWTDLSGNGNNGTLENGPTYGADRSGVVVFDGTNDYVNLGNGASLNITDNASITAIVYIPADYGNPNGFQTIVAKRVNDSSFRTNYGLAYAPPSNVLYAYYNTNNFFRVCSVDLTANIAPSNWYILTATFAKSGSNTVVSIYKNSTILTAQTFANNLAPCSANAQIGAFGGTNEPITGSIALVSIYNRALSPSEVTQNFNATRGRFGL